MTNAPIVMPVETPGYVGMKAPTEYKFETVSAYINAGIIFAYAGCRGKNIVEAKHLLRVLLGA